MSGHIDFNTQKVAALIKAGGMVRKAGGNRIVRDLPDVRQPGLWLRISSPGNARWTFRYQLEGKRNWIALGQASDKARGENRVMSLAEARDTAAECMRMVRLGQDPRQSRQLARAEAAAEIERQAQAATAAAEERARLDARISLGEALDRYIDHGNRVSERRGKPLNRERIRILNVEVRPVLGDVKLGDVTNTNLMRIVRKAEAVSAHKAHKIFAECRAFLNWIVGRPDEFALATSPLTSEAPEYKGERDRVLSADEIRTFLSKLPEAPMSQPLRDVLELQLRLGQRVGEVLKMRRRDIALDKDAWAIPGKIAKNGKPTRVPLPPRAKAIIERALAASRDCEWLFPAKDSSTHYATEVAAKAMLRAQGTFGLLDAKGNAKEDAEGNPTTITSHDLRRTAATGLEALDVPIDVIKLILNHSSGRSVTNRYARGDRFEVAYDALLRWELALEKIIAGHDPFNASEDDRRARAERIRAEMLGDAA